MFESDIASYIVLTVFTVLSFVLIGWVGSLFIRFRNSFHISEVVANNKQQRKERKDKRLRERYRVG